MTDSAEYAADLLAFRRRKDDFFHGPNSPLSAQRRTDFTGLGYYPPDPALRFTVPVERGAGELVEIATTTGESRWYARWGHVTLDLPGGQVRLALYAPPGEDAPEKLFVPFRDATSGRGTYGAGRYVEADLLGDVAELDFNLAYFPYCAYSDGWACPLPPAENWLTVAVEAGERDG